MRYRGHAGQEDVAVLTSPLELIDVRIAIEPPMVRLAVLHANAQDLERMAESLAQVEAGAHDARAFSRGANECRFTSALRRARTIRS